MGADAAQQAAKQHFPQKKKMRKILLFQQGKELPDHLAKRNKH